MNKCKVGYKICEIEQDKYISAFIKRNESLPDTKIIEYKLNKCTRKNPEDGPLAVFKNKEALNRFFNEWSWWFSGTNKYAIFECKYTPSEHKFLWIMYLLRTIIKNWGIPQGTDFANNVTLTKKLVEFDATNVTKLKF